MKFPEDIKAYLGEPNYLILSTIRRDKTIQMSIVWYEFDGKVFKLSTTTARAKYKNAKRNKNVSLLITKRDNLNQYVQVRGEVTSIDKDEDFSFIDSEAKRYLGKNKYPYDLKRKEDRVIISIKPKDFVSLGFESSRK